MFTIIDGIRTLIDGNTLTSDQTQNVMEAIMDGQTDPTQIASFLTALRIRGETSDIIYGAASVMRNFAEKISPTYQGRLIDTCGTGGDNSHTFNISTLSALVAAGAGAYVAKHGNRSVSSKCGSADLLERFGVNLNLEPKEVEGIISKIGIAFLFAPKFHPAMKFAGPVRKALAIRTIFNLLGPLTNPANAKGHVLGVYDPTLVEPILDVMIRLGAEHIYVVCSEPGIDEIIPISSVHIGEFKEGLKNIYSLTPQDFGLKKIRIADLQGDTFEEDCKIASKLLTNQDQSVRRKILVINAAYAIYTAKIATSLEEAQKMAEESLSSGAALNKLKDLVEESQGNLESFRSVFQ